MKIVACRVVCPCGGVVCQVSQDGAWYHLTDKHEIIFRGHCAECNELIEVKREISSLYLMCPDKPDILVN